MVNIDEYSPIVGKLLEKTKDKKVEWKTRGSGFSCELGESILESFTFIIGKNDNDQPWLSMRDHMERTIFEVEATPLPTDPYEERLSDQLKELYDLARWQGLKVEEKLKSVSELLDKA